MSNILNDSVLVLNRLWQAVEETDVQTALCDIYRGSATAIDPETLIPMSWEDWTQLPVRERDRSIMTTRGPVRIPTVICRMSFDKMPKRRPKLSKRNRRKAIGQRDQFICQYTGEYAPDGNVDHVDPKSRGGKSTWDNQVWSAKEINTMKRDMPLHEFERKTGHKLKKKPVAPKEMPACSLIRPRQDRPEWDRFLIRSYTE